MNRDLVNSMNFSSITPLYMTVVACILSFISLTLVIVWAQNNDSTSGDENYLGVPDWKNNIFSWHPVLMVGGFFVAQIVAPAVWVLFPENLRSYAKLTHIALQSSGVITMSLGLYAVVTSKNMTETPHLVSLHSWIGIIAIALYLLNYIFGALMRQLSTSIWGNDLIHNHKFLGFTSLGLSVLAILSGICSKIIRGLCDTSNFSCNISNSIGIIVAIASILTINVGTMHIYQQPIKDTDINAKLNYVNIPNNNKEGPEEAINPIHQ